MVTSLTQSGQLAEIFLPEFHKLNKVKDGLGFNALTVVINRMFLWGGLIILIVFTFAPYFINLLVPGFSDQDKTQATLMFRMLLPYLLLQINNSFFITVLNAKEKFGKAEFLGLTNTGINILSLILLYPFIGVWALIVSLLLGKFIEFIFYTIELNKLGFKYSLIMSSDKFNHNLFFKTMQSTIMYVGATQIYSIVLTSCISFLPEGTFAVFKYVQNLSNKLQSLFIQPFLVIFFTKYSLLMQKSRSILYEFEKNIIGILNVNTFMFIGSILLGDKLLDLIWGSKQFDYNNLELAYTFLMFNLGSILITSLGSVYRKMAVAQGKSKQLYFYWVGSQLTSAVLSFFLITNYKLIGLYFIIPINALLMGATSYIIYISTEKAIRYSYLNKGNLICLSFVTLAVILKQTLINNPIISNEFTKLFILFSFALLLSLHPLLIIFKRFRN